MFNKDLSSLVIPRIMLDGFQTKGWGLEDVVMMAIPVIVRLIVDVDVQVVFVLEFFFVILG